MFLLENWPRILEWLQANKLLLQWLGVSSLVLFILTLFAVPWVVICLPRTYLVDFRRSDGKPPRMQNLPYRMAKNLAGVLFVVSGLAMLFLPGQGMLTILIGSMLIDFPGKPRLIHRILTQPKILRTINRMRRRARRAPLEVPVDMSAAAESRHQ